MSGYEVASQYASGRKTVWLLLGLPMVTIACLSLFPAKARAQSSEKTFDESFRALKRENHLQFDLPEALPPVPPKPPSNPPGWLKNLSEFLSHLFSAIGPYAQYIFYAILAVVAGIILYHLALVIMSRPVLTLQKAKSINDESGVTPLYAPTRATSQYLLETADALAAKGHYTDAVHTLLYRSIQDIDKHCPGHIRRSLTSREISQLGILSAKARDGFGLMATFIENGFFGQKPLTQSDYKSCRQAYVGLSEQGRWAA